VLIAPDATARYWRCGGEIFALGGPLPLSVAGRATGCRPITEPDLRRLADWHRRESAAAPYHRLCLRDAEAVLALLPAPAC